MKRIYFLISILSIVLLFKLTSCSLEKIDPAAKAWLQGGINGQTIVFKDSLGNSISFVVSVKREKEPNTLDKVETITVSYEGDDPLGILKVMGRNSSVEFQQVFSVYHDEPSYHYLGVVKISDGKDQLENEDDRQSLEENFELNGKVYNKLIILPGVNNYSKIYFSKEDGLVGIKTKEDINWYRFF
jgi:hypothetical protein